MKKVIQKIFPEKFGTFFKKIKNKEKFDDELIHISESFIIVHKFVSNQWHNLNIIDYKNISKSRSKICVKAFAPSLIFMITTTLT